MDTKIRFAGPFSYRFRHILIAIAFGLLAVLLTVFYVRHYKSNVDARVTLASVYVASRDIEPGTPGVQVPLKLKQVPAGAIVSGAITSPAELRGLYVTQKINAGEQLILQRFGPIHASGIRGQIGPKMRILEVPGDEHQLLAGTIAPGDHVDVVANFKIPSSLATPIAVSGVVLRNILVLQAAKKSSSGAVLNNSQQSSVLLALTDQEANRLFYVMQNADWSLEFRPPLGTDSKQTLDWEGSVLASAVGATTPAKIKAAIASLQGSGQ
jgi:Flp pilus assembly protein CpaB